MKEKLKKAQPLAYRILENALVHENVAHAYLFHGDAGCGKLDMAILFAQSLLCDSDGFACESCNTCLRVKNLQYPDLVLLDGKKRSIGKEHVIVLESNFVMTSLENSKKIYIIHLVEDCTIPALNTILKFLEEPGEDIVAILITEQLDKILPTIVSRCQPIPFRKMNKKEGMEFALSEGLDEIHAYLCSQLVSSVDKIVDLSEDEAYQKAFLLAMYTIEHFSDDPDSTLLELELKGFNKNEDERVQFNYYASILMVFFRYVLLESEDCHHEGWQKSSRKYTKKQAKDLYDVVMKYRDKESKSITLKMLVASMLIQMKEVL